uniref:Golgin subfamily A member 1 n=1 Tax=Varanus komodoensis TaxID=61221 RepID=A0A8D2ILR5_VARKO
MFAKLKKKIAEEAATAPRPGGVSRMPRSVSKESITSVGADSGDDFPSDGSSSREDLSSQLFRRNEQIRKLEIKLSDYAEQIRNLQKVKEKLENALETHQDSFVKKLQEQNEARQANTAKMAEGMALALEKKDQEWREKLSHVEKERKLLSVQLQEMREKSLSLFQKRDERDELEGFQQQELAKVKHMLLQKEASLAQVEQELGSSTQELTLAREELQASRTLAMRLTAELQELQRQHADLQVERDELLDTGESAKSKITALEQRAHELQAYIQQLSVDLQNVNHLAGARLQTAKRKVWVGLAVCLSVCFQRSGETQPAPANAALDLLLPPWQQQALELERARAQEGLSVVRRQCAEQVGGLREQLAALEGARESERTAAQRQRVSVPPVWPPRRAGPGRGRSSAAAYAKAHGPQPLARPPTRSLAVATRRPSLSVPCQAAVLEDAPAARKTHLPPSDAGEGEPNGEVAATDVAQLQKENRELEQQLAEKSKMIKQLQQRMAELKKTLQKELKIRPDGEAPEAPAATLTVTNNSDLNDSREINFEYLKHVVLKFMSCRESEAFHLIKAVSVLLNFSQEEENMLKETLEYKMSWFGSKPSPRGSIRPSISSPRTPWS